jgi:CheY-like chemotaxis protein
MMAASIDERLIRTQVDRMLASGIFRRSPRLSRFLQYVVQQTLHSEEWKLKEYSIAVEVFGKPEAFDPRIDSTVRVAARQLRAKLGAYYGTDGRHDPVLIRLRPGDYVPRIEQRLSDEAVDDMREVIVVDADRKAAHAVAECLDPSIWRVAAVTNNADRAMSLMNQRDSAVLVAGLSICSGITGGDLLRATTHKPGTGVVAVLSSTAAGALLSQVLDCHPDALVLKPLRKADVQNAVRIAEIRAAHRRSSDGRDAIYSRPSELAAEAH